MRTLNNALPACVGQPNDVLLSVVMDSTTGELLEQMVVSTPVVRPVNGTGTLPQRERALATLILSWTE
eukprot:1388108-Rhodomonas_salina.1